MVPPLLLSNVNRSTLAYWLLGLCNNIGYVVMLSAAHDILYSEKDIINKDRQCLRLSTGIILLADIVPALVVKFIAPFLPLWIHTRMVIIITTSVLGFILVGISNSVNVAIIGVLFTSFSGGLGESSLLSYTVFYRQTSIISAWSSGTGGAGFFGSISYALLLKIGISTSTTMFVLLVVPFLMAISFWLILLSPENMNLEISETNLGQGTSQSIISHPTEISREPFTSRLKNITYALKYIVPLSLVYYFEYVINQGLFELSFVDNSPIMNREQQYRWYQVCYQIGVFISRSSINVIQIDKFWILALLQGVNLAFFVLESIYLFIPSVFIMFIIIIWEGLLGGAAYVNIFYCIQTKENPEKRETVTGLVTTSDSLGIAFAGISAIPLHNVICKLPL